MNRDEDRPWERDPHYFDSLPPRPTTDWVVGVVLLVIVAGIAIGVCLGL